MKWLKQNFFSSPLNSILSIMLALIGLKCFLSGWHYFISDATWSGTANDCREAGGFCYSFIKAKWKTVLIGIYPEELEWRPFAVIWLFIMLTMSSLFKRFWGKKLAIAWGVSFLVALIIMRGGILGLELVEKEKWGGLPLTLLLSVVGISVSYPIGILLALGRTSSNLPVIKTICVGYIELIRGVPLISLLFMASVLFPLFLPKELQIDKLLRAQVAIIMFVSAYMAEVVRGGLQAIPKGQYEAADSLGLNYFQKMRLIILPQALKIMIPPTVGTFIGMLKDTSLVVIIALFDLTYTAKLALKDTTWLGFSTEVYIFIACIYFFFCFSLAVIGRKIEAHLKYSR